MAERHPWHRQHGEGSRQYAAFCQYRDAGEDRSLSKAVERWLTKASTGDVLKRHREQRRYLTHPQPSGYVRTVLRRWKEWSRRWQWVARVQAWDDHVHELDESRRIDRELEARRAEQEENERQRKLRREEARAARTVGRQILLRVLKAFENQELERMELADLLPHLQKVSTLIEMGQRLEQEEEIERRLADLEARVEPEARR